ncbi:hypothetical protein [Halomonas sp.]|uniref:hypothetical protein n=1 Tax=Halomonas sp. TaxID=1486246 RepID=UPI003D11D8B2
MTPGSVFFDTDFHFHDGETGEKLFVVLGSDTGIVVVAKTTSQQHGRGVGYGCQPEDRFPNFYLPLNSCYLKRQTWVCLDEFYELKHSAMLQKRFNGTIKPVCDLDGAITRELQQCAADSMDISQQQEAMVRACMT